MRRNVLIAQALTESDAKVSVLLLVGAKEGADLRLPSRCDCLTLPALAKDSFGFYGARHLELTLRQTTAIRSRVLHAALRSFDPDLLVVDKAPLGALGELRGALEFLRARGRARCVLGLRDILDDPETTRREWKRDGTTAAISRYYDSVWIYGDRRVYDATTEYGWSASVRRKVVFTGYLDQRRRSALPASESDSAGNLPTDRHQILALVGGGQDGAPLAHAFAASPMPAKTRGVILAGPYMPAQEFATLERAVTARPHELTLIAQTREPAPLIARAERVVAMGGYNTVMEVLSHDKAALIVPRTHPRQEQHLRARRLASLGLVSVLEPSEVTPAAIGAWLRAPLRGRPSAHDVVDLRGLERIPRMAMSLVRNAPITDTGRRTPAVASAR